MQSLPPLYTIVDPLDSGRDPVELAAALLAGGARLLQLRWKDATPGELLAAGRAIQPLAREAGALLLVNDRPDIARAIEADGVHLGQEDIPIAAARSILGSGRLVGVSTHDLEQARAAEVAGADYVAVGPIYRTTTKPDALPARGLALLRSVRAEVRCPIVAIGGITLDRAAVVRAAGADSVAMIGELVRAPDVTGAVARVLAALR